MHSIRHSFLILVVCLSFARLGWTTELKPVSISYDNLIRCFPELKDPSLTYKVDLDRLKEIMDEKFIVSEAKLLQRKVQFEDSNGRFLNLKLQNTFQGSRKLRSDLILQQVTQKEEIINIPLAENQRLNPTQDFIESLLLPGKVKSDETSYLDTRLNGLVSAYKKSFKLIQEINLIDKNKSRSLFCEKQRDLGIICTCSKK